MVQGTVVCYFENDFQAALAMVFFLPSLVSFAVSALGWVTHQVLFLFYGLFLFSMHLVLVSINAYTIGNEEVIDPMCPEHTISGFPSQVGFYLGSFISLVLLYSWKKWNWPGTFPLIFMTFAFLTVPMVLIWTEFNSPGDVAFSLIFGILATWIFFSIIMIYVRPVLFRVLNQAPFLWMGYEDVYLAEEKEKSHCLKERDIVKEFEEWVNKKGVLRYRRYLPSYGSS